MSDTYEIGITLALENGVSDGIAVIERDLSTLDQAIAQSVSGLAQLREVASGVLATAEADVRRAAGLAAALPARPAASVASPAVEPAGDQSVDRAAPARGAEAAAVAGGPRPEAAAPASSTVAPQPPAGAATTVEPPQAPVIELHDAVAPAAARGPLAADTARQDSTAGPAAPSPAQPVLSHVLQADVPAMPAVSVAPAQDGGAGAPPREASEPRAAAQPVPQAPDLAALGRSVLAPTLQADDAVPAGERAPAELRTQAAATAQGEARGGNQAAAERRADGLAAPSPAAASREARPAAEPTAASGTSYASAAPAQSTGGMMQISGDVTLDGQVMGRWMSDRMARDAGRPPSGPTGFDASRSPAWPGATVS